ncbi:MAG TPA: branched-chain amino acid ABC transporter permease [Nitrososphaerales archaeon]|nr:branched-chain amino acid ABC transporter permease [Nitrososphaerales archaeon]
MDPVLLGQLALNGVVLGLVYGLVGLGLSLVLGVMGVLNIAHGALYVIGGYFAFIVSAELDLSPILGVLVAVLGTFLVGVIIDRGIVSPVSNDPARVMMITFGLAIVLGQLALLTFGGNPVTTRPIIASSVVFGPFYVQSQTLLASLVGVAVAGLTVVFLMRTKVGKSMRMVSQNVEAAQSIGIRTKRIMSIALGLGSAFSGLAGALLIPIYLDFPDAQWKPLTAAFVVVIVGGLGSVTGSMVGGLLFGILETVGSYFFPAGSDIFVLVLIIAIILVRPTGLFGSKDRI